MNISLETMLQLCIILPLLGALGIAATGRNPNLREGITISTGLAVLYLVINLYLGLKAGESISVHWGIKRHQVADKATEKFGIIMPKSNDWSPLLAEFFDSGFIGGVEYRKSINRHLGANALKLLDYYNKQ